jgi:chromosome segregation ATPase
MLNNNEIVFDSSSGISLEEQKEIMAKINGIAEKNRSRLASLTGTPAQELSFSEKINKIKKNMLFPVIVNAAALFILCAGAISIVSFNGKKDAQVRQGTAVFDITERALIDEIRKDTQAKIAAKEKEISTIASRLEDVDSQLNQLYSSNQELTAEQIAAQERLLVLQTAYRNDLNALNDERSRILEDSRSREARLRALLEERAREYAAAQQTASSELDSARDELSRLSNEQERNATLDAQLAGGLASISDLIQNGDYAQADATVQNLRELNNNTAVSSTRSFQARREFYNKSLDSVETMISHLRLTGGAEAAKTQADLQAKNKDLEDKIGEMQKNLDAYSAGSSGLSQRINEMEASLSTLRTDKTTLESTVVEKDKTIASLESDKSNLTQTVSDLRTVSEKQEQDIADLQSRIDIIQQALRQ